MFAVVNIAGFQEIVKEGDTLTVPLLDSEKDKKMTFEDVLMITADDGAITLGSPFIKGASVEVQVIEHGKGDKIRVVKMRHRKRFTRVKGHTQKNTQVKVTKITV